MNIHKVPQCLVVIALFAVTGCPSTTKNEKKDASKTASQAASKAATSTKQKPAELIDGKMKIELYVMSQCPFGKQAEAGLAGAIEALNDHVVLQLDYIGREQNGKLTSMHGESEVKGDIIQLCAAEELNQIERLKFIRCMADTMRAIPGNWKECAEKQKLDVDKLAACYEGDEGKKLLKASFSRTNERKARSCPTIYIGGKKYRGKRNPENFVAAICNRFGEEAPPACKDAIRKSIKALILTDAECASCDHKSMVEDILKKTFPDMKTRVVDISSKWGKWLYKIGGNPKLPAMFLPKNVDSLEAFSSIKSKFSETKRHYVFNAGSKHTPNK